MVSIKSKLESLFGIEIKVLLAILAVVGGTFGFILIAGLVTRGSTDYFDTQVLRSLRTSGNLTHPIGPVWLFEVIRDITSLGGATMIFLITLFVIGYFILQKQ